MRRKRRGRCGCNEMKGGGVGVIGRKVGGKMRRVRGGGGEGEEEEEGRRWGEWGGGWVDEGR